MGGDDEVAVRYSPCCAFSFGGACDVIGWSELKTCAEGDGDAVFDVWGPTGCKNKAGGLSNNFAAQQWCKDGNQGAGRCWIPYSMNADMDCFPFDKNGAGQWTDISDDGWSATSKFGGATVLLPGAGVPASDFQNASPEHHNLPLKTANIGAVSGAGFIGAAAVVGVFARKRKLRNAKLPKNMEMSSGIV
jgi:hypothetical protein